MYIYIHTYTHTHIYIYIYTCVYIHTHIPQDSGSPVAPGSRREARPRLSNATTATTTNNRPRLLGRNAKCKKHVLIVFHSCCVHKSN